MLSSLKSLFFIAFLFCCLAISAQNKSRERLLMDFGWRFAFGHPFETSKDFNNATGYFSYLAKAGNGDGAAAPGFDDRAWRKLDLPHDWAVEQDFSSKASFSHGFKAIGRDFPDRSVGWYRKTFTIPASDLGRKISLEFDGVFRNSIVWVNGHYLGTEESGYNSFHYDISDVLNYSGDNVVAVRVDATMEQGWFYEGAGIYRHVWLSKTNPLHVLFNGTFVTTTIENTSGKVNAMASIINEDTSVKTFSVIQSIADAQGNVVISERQDHLTLSPFQAKDVSMQLIVQDAKLWDLDNPYLYKLITTVVTGTKELDTYETSFGIRTTRFDAKEGFFLNGKPVKLKGTNNHQDHAGVGSAMPDELQIFRIKALKEMGANAYRCSHNPPTPELLDACDKLGMLVIDENRLMGTNGQMYTDMKGMIERDRNHPCIISWSIGNEEWKMENSVTGARVATTMQAYAKSLDSTRVITAAMSGGFKSGISDVIDVMGYNYLGNGDIDAHHKQFPSQAGMGTEEGSTFATRGVYLTDDSKHYAAAYDKKPRPTFYSIEEGWNFYADRPYLAGMFIWTGFDYRGEATPYTWPSVTSYFGMMDLCGFPKDDAYYLRAWWSDKPTLHLLPHWNWPGREGKDIDVWAYSNCDEIELFLNKKSLGKKMNKINGHLEWKVPYQPGTLKAIGYKNGRKTLTDIVTTTGNAVAIQLAPHKNTLKADGEDIAVITVSVMDKNKLAVPVANDEVIFTIKGPGKMIGVGNGDPTSLEKDKYLDDIKTVDILNMKEKPVQSMADTATIFHSIDTSAWKEAFKNRDYKKPAPAYIYKGSFDLSADFPGSEITFFYQSIGSEQSVYVNGTLVGKDLQQTPAGNTFILNQAILKPGKNEVEIAATPISKIHDWDEVNTNPGIIQVFTPAPAWKRKLFNGLAQIIVQTTKEPGEITLEAKGNNLKPATLHITSSATVARPAVE